MKRMLLGVLLCFSFSFAFSYFSIDNKPSVTANTFIGNTVQITGEDPVNGFASPAEARAIIQDIMDAVGVTASFEVRAAKIPNAAAAMAKGKRYILYNPAFIAALQKATGSNRWASISILAHEVGHHLNGHTLTATGSEHKIELEADEFSGFVLRRMGANLEDAQLAMRVAASRHASRTHPARNDRLVAIANGWQRADEQLAGNTEKRRLSKSVTPSMPGTADADEAAILAKKYIAYDVHFIGDPESKYHITTRNNLVKLSGDELLVYGKFLPTNSNTYPFALKTSNQLLLVSSKGQVVSAKGQRLGYVTAHE